MTTVECPICLVRFPQDAIEAHAIRCLEVTDDSDVPMTAERRAAAERKNAASAPKLPGGGLLAAAASASGGSTRARAPEVGDVVRVMPIARRRHRCGPLGVVTSRRGPSDGGGYALRVRAEPGRDMMELRWTPPPPGGVAASASACDVEAGPSGAARLAIHDFDLQEPAPGCLYVRLLEFAGCDGRAGALAAPGREQDALLRGTFVTFESVTKSPSVSSDSSHRVGYERLPRELLWPVADYFGAATLALDLQGAVRVRGAM